MKLGLCPGWACLRSTTMPAQIGLGFRPCYYAKHANSLSAVVVKNKPSGSLPIRIIIVKSDAGVNSRTGRGR